MADAHTPSIYRLWDDLADFPAVDTARALQHLFAELQRLTDAQHVAWCLFLRLKTGPTALEDESRGWRLRDVVMAESTAAREARLRRFRRDTEKADSYAEDMSLVALMCRGGSFRVCSLHDGFVDLGRFQETPHYDYHLRGPQVADRLWIVTPINSDVESCFLFDRLGERPCFSAREIGRAELALRGIKWFQRKLALSRGIPAARTPCTPTERRVLGWLLTGAAEKKIADELKIAPGTAHNYVSRIFRKFGVRSRAELMALWL